MSKTELEHAITEAAKRVASWTANAKKIEQQIAAAKGRIATADNQRKQSALAASLGDRAAIGELAAARAVHATAVGDLADLGQALNDAAAKLWEAEAEAKGARNTLAKFEADVLKRKRVALAGEIDKTVATLASQYREYEQIGNEIVNTDPLPLNLHGMSNAEGAAGARRIRAAVPKLLEQVFQSAAHDEQKKEPLATTEARFWNLAPVETTAKAA
jgi:chromosome segregation ATPase